MKLVTSQQMATIDRETQKTIPGPALMESAAGAAWRGLLEEAPDFLSTRASGVAARSRIVFVAGSGNNGGDALVMARYCATLGLHRAVVVLASDSVKGDAALQLSAVKEFEIPVHVWPEQTEAAQSAIRDADVIVDGLAGTGLSGALREPHATIVSEINSSSGFVVALDAPSGVGDHVSRRPEAVVADLTLTLGLPKVCLYAPRYRAFCGRISLVSFTIPPAIVRSCEGAGELLRFSDLLPGGKQGGLLPRFALDMHKGRRGIVAVFAGSSGTTGAAVLSSRAALNSGAGLVTLFADEEVYVPLASQLSSVMVRPLSAGGGAGVRKDDRFRSVVVGPGWGTHEARAGRLAAILKEFQGGVVDADGVTLLSGLEEPRLSPDWVITPHPAELGRLLGVETEEVLDDFAASALAAARRYNAIVVAKAVTTVIAHPDGGVAVVDGANPALATAGSGDVLAGLIGGLLGQGLSGWDAARAGVLVHREAGRRLSGSVGLFLASDLPREIGTVAGELVLGEP